MAKTTLNNLVSLILEEINQKSRLEQMFPRDQYIFVEDIYDYPELFQTESSEKRTSGNIPQPEKRTSGNIPQPEPELSLVAEMAREKIFPTTTLEDGHYMRIPSNLMTRTKASMAKMPEMPRIVSLDPITNEFVEGVAIGNEILLTPTGYEALMFENYGVSPKPDRQNKKINYVILKEGWEADEQVNIYMGENLRGKKYGREIERNPQKKLEDKIKELKAILDDPNADFSTKEKARKELEATETRLKHIQEGNSKRYALFIAINQMFDSPQILNTLDSALIPEAWATPRRTEGTWLVVKRHESGADSPRINIDFVSTKDFESVEEAINQTLDIRANLEDDERQERRKREISKQMPRSHGGNVYAGGLWRTGQRVADFQTFQRAGGKTEVYGLLSKAIQEGNITVSTESTLELIGNVAGESYVLQATFSGKMYNRGQSGRGKVSGELFEPITVQLEKPFVDERGEPYDPETFTVEQNVDFFIDGGRSSWMDVQRTGFLPDLLSKLGDQIIEQIEPDEVLQIMLQIVAEGVDQEDDQIF